jgi:peptidyl-prolyl cis-trans isomerase SurA
VCSPRAQRSSSAASARERKIGAALVLALAAWLAAATAARAAKTIERVVAVVNDEIVLDTELEQWAAPLYRGGDIDSAEGRKAWDAHKRKVLDQMIDSKLVLGQANELKLSVTSEEVDRAIEEVKRQNKLDDAQFAEALKQQGFSLDSYRKNLRKQILELKVVNTAVRSRVSVGDDEVRAAYHQSERQMSGERQAHLRQILIAVRDDATPDEVDRKKRVATKVLEQARAGTSFVELAKEHSDDDASKSEGGDLGWVGKGSLVEPLEEVVQAMEPGDIRGPVRTRRGWHLLQLVERKAGDMRPFEDVKEQLRKQLYDQQVEKASQSWIRELRKKAHVEVRF